MIQDFLEAIWRPIGFGEARLIHPRTKRVSQTFFDLGEGGMAEAVSFFQNEAQAGGEDVYYGVLPRSRQRGRAEDVLPTTDVLWADIDAKHASVDSSPWRALAGFPVSPSIVVDSGHGFHAYWLLRSAVPFEDAQQAMRAIAKAVGGDHTHDASRVLRVPGTLNYKDPEDILPVRVVFWPGTRFRWSDLEEYAELQRPRVIERPLVRDPELEDLAWPVWLEDLVRQPTPKGARSEAAFKVVIWLVRMGFSDQYIHTIFQDNPRGIGEKYAERKDGDRWLDVTIRAARSRA